MAFRAFPNSSIRYSIYALLEELERMEETVDFAGRVGKW